MNCGSQPRAWCSRIPPATVTGAVADASSALLTTHDGGNTVTFEIINLAQGGIQPTGQDVDLSFGAGAAPARTPAAPVVRPPSLANLDHRSTGISHQSWQVLPVRSSCPDIKVSAVVSPHPSAWIKPASAAEMAIVAWGSNTAGQKWVMRTHDAGSLGNRLRVEVNGGYIIGEADLADGEWHYVAAVLPDVVDPQASAIQLYVDGQLAAHLRSAEPGHRY